MMTELKYSMREERAFSYIWNSKKQSWQEKSVREKALRNSHTLFIFCKTFRKMSNSSPLATPQNTKCECYKKLQYLGIPLSESEDDELYGEDLLDIHYEKIFDYPGTLKINPQVTQYPIVTHRNLPDIFYQMTQVIPNLSDFEVNMLNFWIMDMFVEGLWTAQKAGMQHEHQRATLLWIAYFFNYIQKHNPSRKELFRHLKKILFMPDYKPAEYPGEDSQEDLSRESSSQVRERLEVPNPNPNKLWELPIPPGTMEGTVASETNMTEIFTLSAEEEEAKSTPSVTKTAEDDFSDRNARHMKIILEILYRIFARLWVYLEMQATFHAMPAVDLVKLPFSLNKPKPAPKVDVYGPPPSENALKASSFSTQIVNDCDTERQLHKNDFILPLQASEEAKAYVKQAFSHTISEPSLSNKTREKRKQG